MKTHMETWKSMLDSALKKNGESWDNVVANTMTEAEMDEEFYSDFGKKEGIEFTLWTVNRVYFPVEYDGAESVGSVSRNPDGKPTRHI